MSAVNFALCSLRFQFNLRAMTDSKSILPLWPFWAADALFLVLAALLLRGGHRPLLWWEALLLTVCVAAGAW